MKKKEDNHVPLTYSGAGVDIDRGEEAVRRIVPLAESTRRGEVRSDLGGFSGLFEASFRGRSRPLLAASTDSVGTKVMIAFSTGNHRTVGIDCVAMCVNDLVVGGAEPLFFLDYLGINRAEPDLVEDLVSGVAEGCRQAGCALLGGEIAEMPDLYREGEYDLVGFTVGVVGEDEVLDGSGIRPGDLLLGIPSSGVHSNGFTLIRKALLDRAGFSLEKDPGGALGRPLGEELLEPTRIYVSLALKLAREFDVRAMAHITGGGLPGNIPRVLPPGLRPRLDWGSWPEHRIFSLIQEVGKVELSEMHKVFNMGIGLVLVLPGDQAQEALRSCQQAGEMAYIIGEVVKL